MNFATFRTLADAFEIEIVEPRPYGGWGKPRSVDFYDGLVHDAMHEELEALGEFEYSTASEAVLARGWETVLETSFVTVRDAAGNLVGGWCHTGWFLGSTGYTLDDAYQATQRGTLAA